MKTIFLGWALSVGALRGGGSGARRPRGAAAVASESLATDVAAVTGRADECLGSELRGQFPALAREAYAGTPLIYFDSGATSQKPQVVLDALSTFYVESNANVHRGAHALATKATDAYEKARETVARFIGARRDEVVWTRGATEAINLVANAWGGEVLSAGDEIVLSVLEHHSNLVPWQLLAKRKGLVLKFARLTDDSRIDAQHLRSLLTNRTRLIAVAHVSNVLGCVAPVAEIVAAARELPDCAVLLDACQSAPHMAIDVDQLGVDFLVASGHKMCGPTGIGFLWGKRERLEAMVPWQGGGEMIDTVTLEGSTFAPPPARFEAGTPPIAQAVALGAACEFLLAVGMDRIERHEQRLARKLWDRLSQIPGLTLHGPHPDERGAALLAFTHDTVHASDLSFFLDQEGVATRAGHHCTQPLHDHLGIPGGSCRASLSLYNTEHEIDTFADHLITVLDMFSALPTPPTDNANQAS